MAPSDIATVNKAVNKKMKNETKINSKVELSTARSLKGITVSSKKTILLDVTWQQKPKYFEVYLQNIYPTVPPKRASSVSISDLLPISLVA